VRPDIKETYIYTYLLLTYCREYYILNELIVPGYKLRSVDRRAFNVAAQLVWKWQNYIRDPALDLKVLGVS